MEDDAQRRAFAEAPLEDLTDNAELMELAECVHDPADPDAAPIRTPEEWNEQGWDRGRFRPKSVSTAQALLAGRIADPQAPDGPETAGAYDQLEAS
jgi:hypothetical protein